MIKMNEENKMYKYLLEHNYISKNENKNPLRQQELSKERAECIANKYNNLIEELQNNWNELKKCIEEKLEKNKREIFLSNNSISTSLISCENDGLRYSLNKMQEMEGNNDSPRDV